MIKSIKVTNYLGDALTLPLRNPDESGFLIRKIDGLGPANADINITNITTNDGGHYNSAHVQTRNIVISIEFVGDELIEDLRLKTYKYFPIKKPIKLEVTTDRRIGVIEGYVEHNEPDIFSKNETTNISIVCPNSYFYSGGDDGTHRTVFSGVDQLFEFPFSNESLTEPLIQFGSINNYQEQTIYYEGDAEVGIIMHMHALGNVGNIDIYNITTREEFHIDSERIATITGSAITSGDDITINTIKGEKSIILLRDGVYYNILNAMVGKSSWFQLSKGDNVFTFTTESGVTNLQFYIDNYKLYEGM